MFTQPLQFGENPSMSFNLPQSLTTLNLVESTEKYEDAYPKIFESSHTQIGVFGDFCLMCGEMIDGEGFDGSNSYCSKECEYHQYLISDSDWFDLSVEGYQLPSYGGSTAVSSAKTTPLNSPHLQPSDRLAILCSGPPPCELLLPFDLDDRLLGATAVAQQYLEPCQKCVVEEGDSEDEKKHLTAAQSLNLGDRINSKDPFTPANSKLKSRPASAQLTNLNHLTCLPELSAKKQELATQPIVLPQSMSMLNLTTQTLIGIDHRRPSGLSSKSSRRVSEPVFGRTDSISFSPTSHQSLCS